jgi:hypothetical protein
MQLWQSTELHSMAAQLQTARLCGGPGVLLTFAACFLSLAASAFSFTYFLGAMIAA